MFPNLKNVELILEKDRKKADKRKNSKRSSNNKKHLAKSMIENRSFDTVKHERKVLDDFSTTSSKIEEIDAILSNS